jgi:signal transduction histidine kinase
MRALRGDTVLAAEYQLTRWDARTFELLCSAVPVRVSDESKITGAVGTFTNITRLNRRCLKFRAAAVLKERRRMAADIHDTLCQSLNAVVLQIEAGIKHFPVRLERAQHHFALAQQSARDSLVEARRSMWTLAQTSQQIGELTTALPPLVSRIFAGTQIKLHFQIQPEVRDVSRFLRRQVHSIVREAVRNILKHSNAKVVRIELFCDGRELNLCVQDDGKGFIPDIAISSGRFGLISMRERTRRLGGQMCIESAPGHGTKITAAIPLCPRTFDGG